MQTYQRGVLLGLTLAEIFIVLLFIFLILFTFNNDSSSPQVADDSENQIGVTIAESTELSEKSFPIPETAAPLSPNGSPLPDPLTLGVDNHTDEFQSSFEPAPELAKDAPSLNQSTDSNFLESSPKTLHVDSFHEAIKEKDVQNGHNWPPVITITEADGYSFPIGSAFISDQFRDMLKTKVVKNLKDNIEKYNANIIEVYGHTDEQPKNGASNLDKYLVQAINGNFPIEGLSASDNVGLGMSRAVAVSQILMQCGDLHNVKIFSYSAGQSINNTGSISSGKAGDDPSRRRIEIRLRGI
jgi:flagellar motor protein MotB